LRTEKYKIEGNDGNKTNAELKQFYSEGLLLTSHITKQETSYTGLHM